MLNSLIFPMRSSHCPNNQIRPGGIKDPRRLVKGRAGSQYIVKKKHIPPADIPVFFYGKCTGNIPFPQKSVMKAALPVGVSVSDQYAFQKRNGKGP